MITRRSRKEAIASPKDVEKNETVKTPPKTKRTPRRSKSRSVDKKASRSVSRSKKSPKKILSQNDSSAGKLKKEPKKKKSAELGDKLEKRPVSVRELDRSSPFMDKIMNNKESSPILSSTLIDDEYANYENELLNNRKVNTTETVAEFGGTFGNLLLTITLPILVILAKIALKAKGNLIPFPKGYLRFANYYDQDVFIWTAAIVILQLLISLVPLAKKTEGLHDGSVPYCYRFSGFVNFFIGTLIVFGMRYYKFSLDFILEIVIKKSVPHIVASVLFALIVSTALYLKPKFSNRNDSLNFIQQFFIGRSSNPTLGPMNLKLALYRYSNLMTILINSLVILDNLNKPVNQHLYFVAVCQILYAIDKLIFEFHLLPSFYLKKEKVGYWTIIQHFLLPIINFLPIQILLAQNLSVNYIVLSISTIIFLSGFICQRYSDLIKYQYGTNSSLDRKIFRTKTFSTIDGKRIIVDGIWSYIKHPNYLGTIIVHLALILPVIEPNLNSLQASWPVFLYPLYYIITLSHRCSRISTYLRSQYGFTWDNSYAVQWNLIPKVY